MKKAHRDTLITIGVTIAVVLLCIVAIFGIPTGREKSRLMNFDGVEVDTIQEGDIPILDNDVQIPLSVADTLDSDSADIKDVEADAYEPETNDTLKTNK